MRRAFAEKDASFDGLFVVAVRTTGIFCRPTCRARPPRPENDEFFADAAEAAAAGYRACKMCRPTEPPGRAPAVVGRLKELAAAATDAPLREDDLRELGIDPATARRQFRAHCGVTFAAYQRSLRMGAALTQMRRGAGATAAQLAAGFESGSGFREAVGRELGSPASKAAAVEPLVTAQVETPIGSMQAIARDEGLVLIDFLDRRGMAGAIERLRRRFGSGEALAAIVPGDHVYLRRVRAELAEFFAGRRTTFTVPLAPHGTPFERRAWDYLRAIPPGETRTYGAQARAIGAGGGARAVGRANGMNYLSILIPCHRVVGAGGALTGYGGGLWRKRWLLEHERAMTGAPASDLFTTPVSFALATTRMPSSTRVE
jgi:AraC family transcriptional regulator of adaptative response/methylated-DNA-[protein]-cysteine methyltransferase